MIENVADNKFGVTKEMLDRSPLLAKFLDPTAVKDPKKWLKSLYEESSLVQAQIENEIGKNNFNIAVFPLAHAGHELDIFPNKLPIKTRTDVVEVLLGIGYQLANADDCVEIIPEVLDQLDRNGFIDRGVIAARMIQSYIEVGAYWKLSLDGEFHGNEFEKYQIRRSSVIEDFLEKNLNSKIL